MAVIGVDPSWEQFRAIHKEMHNLAKNRYRDRNIYEPGHILMCEGSLNLTFSRYLDSIGVKLRGYELPSANFAAPKRYCIVNRHIRDQLYEVFLATTFSGAKNADHIDGLARYFGMPIGNTKWFNDLPGLVVIPPMLGVAKSSFVFAIPTILPAEPSIHLPEGIRVPPGELNRLRTFSKDKLELLPKNQAELRKALRLFLQDRAAYTDLQDDFKPTPRRRPLSIEDYDDMQHFIPNSAIISSQFKPKRLQVPEDHDITWPLRHISRDINPSRCLQLALQRFGGDQGFSLPKPYYPPRLPISLRNLWRTIR